MFFLKTLLTLADFGTCLVLFAWLRHWGRPPHLLLLYAWNPLAIKEFAGSGHVDALMVLLLTASIYLLFRRREVGAQISLGAAVLAKVGAVVVAPIVLRHTRLRTWWVFPTTLVVLSLPLLNELIHLFRGLGAYSQEWTFNSGPWVALREIFSWMGLESAATWAHLATKTVVLLVIFWATRISSIDENRLIQAVFLILATVVLLNPAVMPWYLLWPLPFAALIGRGSWFVLTGLSLLSYLVYYDPSMQAWWLWIEYGVFALVLATELRHRSSEA